VTYRISPDSSIRLSNLQAGALDITEVAPLDVATVQKEAKLRIASTPSLGYGALTVNIGPFPKAETPLGRDARVRHALELAIDRDAINQVVFAGLYVPNAQATSPISPLYDPQIVPPKRDVAAARALLAQAGVKTPLTIPLTVYNTPQGVQAGEVIQSMAAEAGFDIKVVAMEFGTVLATVNGGDYALTLGGWSGLLDTDSNAWSFLHTGGALNMSRYSNAKVDGLLDAARAETGVAERRGLYGQVFTQVNADLPLIYLWTPRNVAGYSAKISGFSLRADGLLRLQGVSSGP
jgi:peptide/nickel transport system substrate-binding protein